MDSQSDLYVAEVETTTDDFIEAFELYYMLQSYGGNCEVSGARDAPRRSRGETDILYADHPMIWLRLE